VPQLAEANRWLQTVSRRRLASPRTILTSGSVLLLKRVLGEPGCKALLVLPYVALVQEKVRWLRNVVRDLRLPENPSYDEAKGPWRRRADEGAIRVVGFFGGGKVRATWDDFDIGVCTLEKARQLPSTDVTPANSLQANALVNQAIDDCSIPKLRAVVLDELHMIDDDHRGYLLELIATKLLSIEQPIQIVGMSATLPVRQRPCARMVEMANDLPRRT